MSSASARSLRGLRLLLLATFVASILHYADNLLFFEQYPEPPWINRSLIDAFWFLMTPLGWIGYRMMRRGMPRAGALVLLGYAACNLLTLGHYAYAPMCGIAARIHAFILLEAIPACLLAALAVSFFRRQPATI